MIWLGSTPRSSRRRLFDPYPPKLPRFPLTTSTHPLPAVLDSPTFVEPAPDALAAANARASEIIANYTATERLAPAAARKG